MIATTASHLGIGLYTVQEAAFYSRVPVRMLNRWIFGDSQGDPVVHRQLEDSDSPEKIVTFFDFVQALAIRAIRTQHNVPLQRIRDAVDFANSKFGITYPFARWHKTYLVTDGAKRGHGHIVIEVDGKLTQISGREAGNRVMEPIIEPYMFDITFDDKGLAEQYCPLRSENDQIIMNPHLRFGQPILKRCGYSAETLRESVKVEGSVEAAAEAYDVDVESVKLALRYYDSLLSPTREPA